jgi:2-amino-4-hydroxy-6-hydroxymethyldihydropteridine diphosphokinase
MKKAFLSIGTNLGDRKNNLENAARRIEESIGHILTSSSVYETEPWGFQSEYEFLNMVLKVETDLTPSGLLGRILMIESQIGRSRRDKQYSSRIIDIDLLLYNDLIINEINLKIPHPLMHERKFVLVPLCEIAPEMIHPILKMSFTSLLKSCKDKSNVEKCK